MATSYDYFDPEYHVPLGEAVGLVKSVRPTGKVTSLTIRKFLVGLAHSGEVDTFAKRFSEVIVHNDEPELPAYRSRWNPSDSLPIDFWRYSIATGASAQERFAESTVGNDFETTWDRLDRRIRKNDAFSGSRCRVMQNAERVYFPRQEVEAYARDPNWQRWIRLIDESEIEKKRGRIQIWKWDQVKASLTMEAARDPSILTGGTGPIVQYMISEFRTLHYDQHPDISELYEYARLFFGKPDGDQSAPI
jgi:hypothetical protein